jgi:F-type H+/Na+-transporting ATPase subunit alpha
LAAFAQFGSDLDKATQQAITRGQRMTEILKQPEFQPVPVEEQIVIIYAGTSGALDDIPLGRVSDFETKYLTFLRANHAELLKSIRTDKKWTDTIQQQCDQLVKKFKAEFLA